MTVAELIRIGRVEDIPMLEGRSVAIDGRRIAIFRTPSGFHALDNACPHARGPLADGIVADDCVTCPLHGWRFRLDSGEALNAAASVATYEVVEDDGELWLRADNAAEAQAS